MVGPDPAGIALPQRANAGQFRNRIRRLRALISDHDKGAARATGQGLKTASRVTVENRHYLLPVLNGFVGDQLANAEADPDREDRGAAIPLSFREGGRDVSVADLCLGPQLHGPGRTVVVAIHGLMCDEIPFQETRRQSTSPTQPGHGARLVKELGVSMLYLRYNSGLHISANGQALAALLEELVTVHGDTIDCLVLLCHSMGGLVARSAGFYGQRQQHRWVERLSTLLLIGTPSRGSFLEQFANLSAFVLNRVGNIYTRIAGWIIDERSDGIKDLRFGLMVDEDWADNPHDDRLIATKTSVPPIPGVEYHVIAGTLPEDSESLLSLVFGDGLVGRGSAAGDQLFRPDDSDQPCGTIRFFPGRSHFDLLSDPEIGAHVVELVRPHCCSG